FRFFLILSFSGREAVPKPQTCLMREGTNRSPKPPPKAQQQPQLSKYQTGFRCRKDNMPRDKKKDKKGRKHAKKAKQSRFAFFLPKRC
ncbi:hypothetical protein, partial [Salmonella sp. s29873]|uniref:hypothetical protein n=1 Tax=Salmonella sp. s29873 TaxID=3159634 RepID=UPI00397FA213